MPELKILLLGTPRVEVNGEPLVVDTRKAVALLSFLASSRESHSRDSLAALFWPDVDEARAALRRTLSALHRALGEGWLEVERESIGLRRDAGCWLDVDQFQRSLAECRGHGHPAAEECDECLGPLTRAAAFYRDDFMAGFTLRDSPGFDDWQFFQAESLRRELAGALERLAHCHARRRNLEDAIAVARRWLSLDPLHEPAHRMLMQLYAQTGQRALALRQYRECVRALESELGVPPLEETTALYEGIKQGSKDAGGRGSTGAREQWEGTILPPAPRSQAKRAPLHLLPPCSQAKQAPLPPLPACPLSTARPN